MEHKSAEKFNVIDPERTRRIRIVTTVAPGVLGALMLLGILVFDFVFQIDNFRIGTEFAMLIFLAVALLGVSGVSALMTYLQTGFKREDTLKSDSTLYQVEIQRLRREMQDSRSITASQSELSARLSLMEQRLETTVLPSYDLADPEREDLLARLKENIEKIATHEILEDIRSTITENQSKHTFIQYLDEQYERTIGRLSGELSALSRRGNLNLSLGILTAVSGIILLGYFVLNTQQLPADVLNLYGELYTENLSCSTC